MKFHLMNTSKYDATVIETLFNMKDAKCAICLDKLNQPTSNGWKSSSEKNGRW